ncbi:MAG: hypothetical protein FWJ85_13970 [Solitalea sp.]
MEKICKTFRVLFVLTVAFSLTSCKETDDPAPSETTDTNKVRLKHLTTEQEITEALGAYVAGWDPGELHLTELGTYGELPYVYYYRIGYFLTPDGAYQQHRSIRCDTDGTGEETLESILEEDDKKVEVNDSRLENLPGVFIVKNKENKEGDWLFTLYAPQSYVNGKTTHKVTLMGLLRATVPSDHEAVTAILSLLEIKE